jgi:TonB family protein
MRFRTRNSELETRNLLSLPGSNVLECFLRPERHRQMEEQMFNNLIESSSHTRELKRRGSFLIFTTATYVLLFVIAGVLSIYAYDAQLSDPGTDAELVFIPLQPDRVVPEPVRVGRTNPPAGTAAGPRSVRPVLIDRTNNPQNVPDTVSAIASPIPPAHKGTVLGPVVLEPPGSEPGRDGGDSASNGNGNLVVVRTTEPPPPAPTPAAPRKKIITSPGVLNGLALSLPKPSYPPMAKLARAQGPVNVQVVIDETGKVISAKAVSGSPLLMHAAQQAALGARFSPTRLGEQAVKVSGVITYNFVLQ